MDEVSTEVVLTEEKSGVKLATVESGVCFGPVWEWGMSQVMFNIFDITHKGLPLRPYLRPTQLVGTGGIVECSGKNVLGKMISPRWKYRWYETLWAIGEPELSNYGVTGWRIGILLIVSHNTLYLICCWVENYTLNPGSTRFFEANPAHASNLPLHTH